MGHGSRVGSVGVSAGRTPLGGWSGRGIASSVLALFIGAPLAASADRPGVPAPATSSNASSITDSARRGHVVPPAIEDVEQVCALLTSCDHLPIPASMVPTDFAACVRSIGAQLASPSGIGSSLLIRECGLRANSCAELRTCGLRGASPTACAGRGKDNPAGYCDIDGRALSCWHERVAGVRDCPRGGEQCSVREGEAACSLGPCPKEITEGAAPVCSASGTRILRCEHGVLNSLDCAAFGLICTPGTPATAVGATASGAACAPPTATCSGTAKRCEGDVAVSCYDGHEVRVECGAAGMTCNALDHPERVVGSCVAPAPASPAPPCDSSAPARCDGSTVRYCASGRARAFPCKALGFNRCVSDAGGARCG
jgi:hypothetical protein